MVKKGAIQERELHVSMDSVSKQVKNQKWEKLVKYPEVVVVLVVREFYANMQEHRNFWVFFRGKMVPFDKTTNNIYYKLTNINNDGYGQMLRSDVNWEFIKEFLCLGTTTK